MRAIVQDGHGDVDARELRRIDKPVQDTCSFAVLQTAREGAR